MTFPFRCNLFAGLAAATLCLAPMTSNEALAQNFWQQGTNYGYFSPYGGGYDTGFYGGQAYRGQAYRGQAYGGQAYRYTEFGQGPYGANPYGVYALPPQVQTRYGRGTEYRGGLFPQNRPAARTFFRGGSRYYSPFGYGVRY